MTELAWIEIEDHGGTPLLRVAGEIDLSNAARVIEALGDAVPGDASVVLVDLSETEYLDSTGIAMLFRLGERLRVARQELRLVVPPDAPIRRAVELTNLNRVIPVLDRLG